MAVAQWLMTETRCSFRSIWIYFSNTSFH